MTVVWELAGYKIDLVGMQEFRREKGSTVREGDYIFLYGKETKFFSSIGNSIFCTPQE